MKVSRPYQNDCILAIKNAFAGGERGVAIEVATGLGKAHIIARIAEMVREKGGRVLVLVNRDNLVEQLFNSIVEQGLLPTREQGLYKASPLSDMVVGSIQSLQGNRLLKWNREHFRLVLTDEAHGAAAKTFRTVLDYFESSYHIFLTATIERHDKQPLWGGVTKLVYSMPLTKGIEEGWLVPFEFEELPVPILISDTLASKKMFTEKDESEVFSTNEYLPRLFAEAAARVTDRKALFFWPNCDASREADKHFQGVGIESMHVDGYESKNRIAEILAWFREPCPRSLHNADLLSMGYDNPSIDCVGIMRLSRSVPMLKQRLGRGTRPVVPVDNYSTAEERRAAILASDKPQCRVLDLMLQLGEVQNKFADATCLITDDLAEREFLRQENRRAGMPVKMDEIADKLRAKRETDKEKQLAKLAEDAANAAFRRSCRVTRDAPFVKHILGRVAEPHWKDASQKQIGYLRHLGYTGDVPSAWHAHRLLTAYIEFHESNKMETV